jgi:hypothetical protein
VTRRPTRFDDQRRPANRRPGIIPGRRFALAFALTGVVLAGSQAVAVADQNQTVDATIYQAGGAPTDRVSLGALEANTAQCPIYKPPNQGEIAMYGQGGKPLTPQAVGNEAWSLATVLGCLQTPVALVDVKGVTVVQSNGVPELSESSELSPGDLSPPGDFATSGEVPLIYSDGTNIFYYRPWRGGADDNASDTVQDGSPQPFAIEVFEGPLLTVTPTASEATVTAGATVTFNANVTPAGESGLSYTWGFDGGAQGAQGATMPAPSATFASAGKYNVTVQVTDDAGGGGGATIPITVNPVSASSPTTPTGGGSGGGPSGTGSAPSGPAVSSGTTPGAGHGKPVKTSGTSVTTHNAKPAAPGKTTRERKSSTHATTTTPAGTGTTGTTGTTSASGHAGASGSSTGAGAISTRIKALTPHAGLGAGGRHDEHDLTGPAGHRPADQRCDPTVPGRQPAGVPPARPNRHGARPAPRDPCVGPAGAGRGTRGRAPVRPRRRARARLAAQLARSARRSLSPDSHSLSASCFRSSPSAPTT